LDIKESDMAKVFREFRKLNEIYFFDTQKEYLAQNFVSREEF
jgi:hypothetical protein